MEHQEEKTKDRVRGCRLQTHQLQDSARCSHSALPVGLPTYFSRRHQDSVAVRSQCHSPAETSSAQGAAAVCGWLRCRSAAAEGEAGATLARGQQPLSEHHPMC